MAEISEMNTHKKVREKFDCLLKCSRKIFEAIRESTNAPAGADEFLPAFTHVILKSNPTLLQSNMSFISRFSIPSKVCRGETGNGFLWLHTEKYFWFFLQTFVTKTLTPILGYYFATLCSAVTCIQDINAEKLGIPKEEFEAYMSNAKLPPNLNRKHVSATKSLENSLKQMEQLNKVQETLKARADQLSESMER